MEIEMESSSPAKGSFHAQQLAAEMTDFGLFIWLFTDILKRRK